MGITPSPLEARETARIFGPSTWSTGKPVIRVFDGLAAYFALPIIGALIWFSGSAMSPWILGFWEYFIPVTMQPVAASALVVLSARLLFKFRTASRIDYGRLELYASFVTAFWVIDQYYSAAKSVDIIGLAVGLASACYIAVRGFDNIAVGKGEIKELAILLKSFIPNFNQRTTEEWKQIILKQDLDFKEHRSNEAHSQETKEVTAATGKRYRVTAEPWWYETVGKDVCILFEIDALDDFHRKADHCEILNGEGASIIRSVA